MHTKHCLVLILLCVIKLGIAVDINLYVSPSGSDENNGSDIATPLKTLHEALQRISRLSRNSTDTVYIELRAGHHDLDKTLYINQNNIVIRSYQGEEVYVTGGTSLAGSFFKPVTDHTVLNILSAKARRHIRVAALPAAGITDYGANRRYGFYTSSPAPLEVFYNSKPLHLARWPDEGFINIVSVPDGKDGLTFVYNSTVPATWGHEDEPWVYGYWYWSWADQSIMVAELNATSMAVHLIEKSQYGLRTGHFNEADAEYLNQGGYFRFENILSALDSPGEYYLDRSSGNLYVWMPNTDGSVQPSDSVYVSLIDTCISMNRGVHDIVFSDFTLEVCRYLGVHGNNNRNIRMTNMEIRNTGGTGFGCVADCRDVLVTNCLIHDVDGGMFLYGGDRKTLESSGIVIQDSEIFDFSRLAAVGTHAITANGVGHVIQHNSIYNGQYTGIWYYGNDIVMERNYIHHLCMNASDCGALHTGRDWTTRGNIIRHNIVHNILRLVPGADCRGVMLDDQSSSTTITGNVFYNNHVHANIGGGRDNIISNNVMYNATKSSMQFDRRGMQHTNDQTLVNRLQAMPYTGSLWAMRYPELANIDSKNRSLPEGNQISKNIVYSEGQVPFYNTYSFPARDIELYFNITDAGFSLGSVDHFDTTNSDFRLKCLAAEWANRVGFVQVPAPDEVGPRGFVGPTRLKRVPHRPSSNPSQEVCTTHAPATASPVPSYFPDGSRKNDLFNVSALGCWLDISACSSHPEAAGRYRDNWGEANRNTGQNESACLQRAVDQWHYCGAKENEQVAATYGPSGATKISGDGCFMAEWGCPLHRGPSDGHVLTTGHIYRDTYAEQHLNASHNEEKCLSRAIAQWRYCGSHSNHPITSIYRPTGAVRTAGAGCWIHVGQCPNLQDTPSMFYDAWGATNYDTDNNEAACLGQASYYWRKCGSDSSYPVTAYYRPSTASRTAGM